MFLISWLDLSILAFVVIVKASDLSLVLFFSWVIKKMCLKH